ncbi:hypothetical protein AU467_20220 [Mesorhizobium loti]|uniref:2-oxoacid dehydrogenase acyltransferase catalytic domain-containing protein n=1 Tax=Rhizobium loti TaxID=381 RepID=A0A101KTF5_RHILI|nr:hypothetical protein AU467_20220 [Mesorhizobium loti]
MSSKTILPSAFQKEGCLSVNSTSIGLASDRVENADTGTAKLVASEPSVAPGMAAGGPKTGILKLFEKGSYDLVKHDKMRKTIAKRLTEAKHTVPHFYASIDCDLGAILMLRAEFNAAAPLIDESPAYKISINDMTIKALALALRDVPDANVSWTDEAMIRHKNVDVAVAVSIPGGLITPIVRCADEKSLVAIANEMRDLSTRARARKLAPDEYQGGSTAISNLGMMGISSFSAVINPPHSTILAVGAAESRAIVKNGALTIGSRMTVTLSCDHRCVDGSLGAELLAAFKRHIETPTCMLV